MRIIELHLENFQQIKNMKIAFNAGGVTRVEGRNETGKTTIANAYMWLLTGKSYTNEPNYSPQTTKGNELVHNLEHGVTGVFENADGRFTLRRAYKEKYAPVRGSLEKALVGGTYIYEIDGVNSAKKAYDAFVEDAFGTAEGIQILSKPEFFSDNTSEMSWQRRREIVMQLTGDISDEDVIASNPVLADLTEFLQKDGGIGTYTVDQLKEIARSEAKKTAEQRDGIPARIDENHRMMPERLSEAAIKVIDDEIMAFKRQALEEDRAAKELADQDEAQAKRAKIAGLKVEVSERKASLMEARTEVLNGLNAELEAKNHVLAGALAQQQKLTDKMAECKATILSEGFKVNALDNDINALEQQVWEGDLSCYVCGQALPESDIQAATEAFNQKKAEDIEALKAKRVTLIDTVNEAEKTLETLAAKEPQVTANTKALKDGVEAIRATFLEKNSEALPFDEDPEIQQLLGEIERLRESTDSDESRKEEIAKRKEKRDEFVQAVLDREEILKTQEQVKVIEARIVELEKEKQQAEAAHELAARKIWLTQQFSRTKATLLSNPINALFDPNLLQFILFNELKNGDTIDACEVLVRSQEGNLVEFKAANRAGRINAGLEIINVLADLYGRSLPVIVDNAESINELHAVADQVIAFYVTEHDKINVV